MAASTFLLKLESSWNAADEGSVRRLGDALTLEGEQSIWLVNAKEEVCEALAAIRCGADGKQARMRYLLLNDDDLSGIPHEMKMQAGHAGPADIRKRHRDLVLSGDAASALALRLARRNAEQFVVRTKDEVLPILARWLGEGRLHDPEDQRRVRLQLGRPTATAPE